MTATASAKGLLDPTTAERVQLDRWLPSDDAAVVIERFWTLHFDVSSPQVQPLLPHPCVNVAFGTADPACAAHPNGGTTIESRVVGGSWARSFGRAPSSPWVWATDRGWWTR